MTTTEAPVGRRAIGLHLVVGSAFCVLALVFLVGGGWALWKDRVDRDADGYVSFGTTDLRTETHAIVDLHGDGPTWLYEETMLGDAQVRHSPDRRAAVHRDRFDRRRSAISTALEYATIDSFEVTADTTHAGEAPAGPPSREAIWEASTQGTGQQSLLWTLRWATGASTWPMNADSSADVDVRGDASATLPMLPRLAGGLLVAATASGVVGGWIPAAGLRRQADAS